MSEIRKSSETIGLGQYADAFEANDIDLICSLKLTISCRRILVYRAQAIDCAFGTQSQSWVRTFRARPLTAR